MSNKSKKRKRQGEEHAKVSSSVDTTKPTAIYKPQKGRAWTVSVALPSSIISNVSTHDGKTNLAGRIARALAVFCVDEAVIFDDGTPLPRNERQNDYERRQQETADAKSGYTAFSDPGNFLYHILSYLETPPNLRRMLFPHHPNLRTAGALPSLDMPHHLKREEDCEFREGVTIEDTSASQRTLVDCGLTEPVEVARKIPPNSRVTLQFIPDGINPVSGLAMADVVSPDIPREQSGYYWGYNMRMASKLSSVFTEAPFDGGYDYTIGTSERGMPLASLIEQTRATVPTWQHLLVVFGGVAGLEVAVRNDDELSARGISEPSEVVDAWVNLVEGQGSRTIRTEEAVWIGLMGLQSLVQANNK